MPSVHDHFDQKIAIIGAGPAGLSCAYYLALLGYSPVVFEKHEQPGGMMMYGIPSYKLEKGRAPRRGRDYQEPGRRDSLWR
ncbi:MAG: FAD-dependent oxidoreductase [Atopobiaceae bacterium]|nr:FAD-dependent oxidoreductase [Atopobiaceae bacterium]